jgi:hypothetical protein
VAVVTSLAVERQRAVPQPTQPDDVQGSYVVRVPPSDIADEAGMVGRWVVSLSRDGSLRLVPPRQFDSSVSGASYRIEGEQLTTNAFVDQPGCQVTNRQLGVYTIDRTADGLTFHPVADDCPARVLLFGQLWKDQP